VKFAGGSYIPKTEVGFQVDKIIRGETTSTDLLQETTEEVGKE
jgi:hypothetical protein